MPVLIKNASGELESFDIEKLRTSLKKARASDQAIESIIRIIESEIEEGMTTHDIYKHALALLLKTEERPVAARYSLRRALMQLGPSGFPFESYLAELFKAQGFTTETDITLKGKCVAHEIDVIGHKPGELALIEAKFHNEYGYKTDVKVALYIRARFDDLKDTQFDGRLKTGDQCRCLLVTNTKFTRSAIEYGECAGITLIGWGYPDDGSLQDLIETAALHPLSCLTTLSHKEKGDLHGRGVVLCRSVLKNKDILRTVGLSDEKIRFVLEEAERLCIPGA